MAFPNTPPLDNFDRTNEGPPPSASWGGRTYNVGAQLKVVSNVAQGDGTGAATDDYTDYWGTLFSANQEAYVKINTKSLSNPMYFDMRVQTPGTAGMDAYEIVFTPVIAGSDTVRFYRIDNMAFTQLGSTINFGELAIGDSVGASIVGTLLTAYYKPSAGAWTAIATMTDATYNLSGYISLGATDVPVPAWSFDDFGGGAIPCIATPSKTLVTIKPGNATISIIKSAAVNLTQAIVKITTGSPTVIIKSSKIASTSQTIVKITTGVPVASYSSVASKIVTTTQVLINIVSGSPSASSSTGVVSKTVTATKSIIIIKTNSPSVVLIKSAGVNSQISLISIKTSSPSIIIIKSSTVATSKSLISIIVNSLNISGVTGSINGVNILELSKIENNILVNSRIDKFIRSNCRIEKSIVSKNRIEKTMLIESSIQD